MQIQARRSQPERLEILNSQPDRLEILKFKPERLEIFTNSSPRGLRYSNSSPRGLRYSNSSPKILSKSRWCSKRLRETAFHRPIIGHSGTHFGREHLDWKTFCRGQLGCCTTCCSLSVYMLFIVLTERACHRGFPLAVWMVLGGGPFYRQFGL